MKKYYNIERDEWYYEGRPVTKRLDNGALFSGVPSARLLREWGFEEVSEPTAPEPTEADGVRARMAEIQRELAETDYLALKAYEGEDMSEHVGWKEQRAALRREYRECEGRLAELATLAEGDEEEENQEAEEEEEPDNEEQS